MKLSLCSRQKDIEAYAHYDEKDKTFTVLKGSKISAEVATTGAFRGANSILKAREGCVTDRIVTRDVVFKSASTAANFVTGRSTNELIAWKAEDGIKLKQYLK